jgi:hypothetical protein
MPIIPWLSGLDFGFGYDVVRGEPKQRGVQGSGAPPIEAGGQEGDVSFSLSITARNSTMHSRSIAR